MLGNGPIYFCIYFKYLYVYTHKIDNFGSDVDEDAFSSEFVVHFGIRLKNSSFVI